MLSSMRVTAWLDSLRDSANRSGAYPPAVGWLSACRTSQLWRRICVRMCMSSCRSKRAGSTSGDTVRCVTATTASAANPDGVNPALVAASTKASYSVSSRRRRTVRRRAGRRCCLSVPRRWLSLMGSTRSVRRVRRRSHRVHAVVLVPMGAVDCACDDGGSGERDVLRFQLRAGLGLESGTSTSSGVKLLFERGQHRRITRHLAGRLPHLPPRTGFGMRMGRGSADRRRPRAMPLRRTRPASVGR